MTNSTHISIESLANIADGRATVDAREAALAHISNCSACGDALRALEQLILMMRSDSATDAPRDVLTSVMNIFSPEKRSPLRRVVALLTFDSRTAGPAFGMRSLRDASRQLLYSAEDTDLDLRITMQNDECVLAGQVIGAGCTEGDVEISGVTGRSTATLSDVCEFTLPPVPAGNCFLILRMHDREIEIPELELKV